jgi:hypothetical protein
MGIFRWLSSPCLNLFTITALSINGCRWILNKLRRQSVFKKAHRKTKKRGNEVLSVGEKIRVELICGLRLQCVPNLWIIFII